MSQLNPVHNKQQNKKKQLIIILNKIIVSDSFAPIPVIDQCKIA
jgi:hypothetical protein